jgi:uncharacterized protein YbaR (Trm112 family)
MTVQKKLLDVLVCPACKGPLAAMRWQGNPADAPAGELPLLGLDCNACRLRYPIVDDIPVMLVDQAQRIPA